MPWTRDQGTFHVYFPAHEEYRPRRRMPETPRNQTRPTRRPDSSHHNLRASNRNMPKPKKRVGFYPKDGRRVHFNREVEVQYIPALGQCDEIYIFDEGVHQGPLHTTRLIKENEQEGYLWED